MNISYYSSTLLPCMLRLSGMYVSIFIFSFRTSSGRKDSGTHQISTRCLNMSVDTSATFSLI